MTKRLLIVLCLGLLAGMLAACGGSTQSVPTDAVALVNGVSIPKVQFNSLMNATAAVDKANKTSPPKAGTAAYKSVQDRVIAFLVQLDELQQKGQTLGVNVTDAQIQAQIAKVKKQYFAGNEAKFEKGLAAQGLTLSIYQLEWRSQLLSQGIYNKVTKNVKVTPAQVSAYYAAHKTTYTTAERRTVRHILVNSKTLADQLEAQLKNGADFATLAKKYSKDPGSAKQGGKLTVSKGETVANFDKVAFSLKTGATSPPVHTQYGWHIIQALTPITPAKVTPLASVEQSIQSTLLTQKKSDAMNTWLNGVKAEYAKKIVYAAGYTPSSTTTATTTTG
ncbi:MAG: peptidylprolyl isomerase [Actinobacteria bacterium]|nr:peptidylprolyl isomerase [Actinomycetota bacterium]MBV8481095.1 peptidylprolyl isomerase [Actinomycetota bacterium]